MSFIRLRQRRNVDFPQPDGPMNAVTRSSCTSIETSFKKMFRLMTGEQKSLLVSNIAGAMAGVSSDVVDRQLQHFYKADPAYGEAIAKLLNVQLNEV